MQVQVSIYTVALLVLPHITPPGDQFEIHIRNLDVYLKIVYV